MIIDLEKFIEEEQTSWDELEAMLDKLDRDAAARLPLDKVRRMHYLYQRASADLTKVKTFASEPELARYLEALVARAYGEVHAVSRTGATVRIVHWFTTIFPATFQRHVRAFWLAVAVTLVGVLFGGFALLFDPEAKAALLPFEHLQGDPSERVAWEEHQKGDRLQGQQAMFSSFLMTHNTKVSIFTLSLGMTFGLGTLIALFYNGVILGAVCFDYVRAGEGVFLTGWLLPHGSVEIPAILLAGQAGFILAGALIGWGRRERLRVRMRKIGPDLVTLIGGVAILLVWAGIIEGFFSQYHEPILPYGVKIAFGIVELVALFMFLFWKRSDA